MTLPRASRTNDPETSYAAESSVTPEPRWSMIRKVAEVVWFAPGVSRENVAQMLFTDNWDKVGKRLADAERLGLVYTNGKRQASNGRWQQCYWPVEQEEQGRLV